MKKILLLKLFLLAVIPLFLYAAPSTIKNTIYRDACFLLVAAGDPLDPLDYIPYSGMNPNTDCPGNGKVCIICVFDADLYTPQNAPTPAHVGMPKVDLEPLKSIIAAALASPADPYVHSTGRVVYKRS